jgi:transglutaminase-like putative cysteine protease
MDTLSSTEFVDSDHPRVRDFAQAEIRGASDPVEQARRLYRAVRDEIVYDPYVDFASLESFRASACLEAGRGFCVAKAALLAASARAVGISGRVGFADVRNHLASPRLLELVGDDVFIYHGYTALFLGGRWVKATPTFNRSLCERFAVKPLDFDGRTDALFHPFDREGRKHMEYLADRGQFEDVPAREIIAAFRARYPRLFAANKRLDTAFQAGPA